MTDANELPRDEAPRRRSWRRRSGPDGVLFFERSSGLNVLFDEIRPPSDCWARAPRQVSIALTNACNLHCSYCYAPKHKAALNVDDVCAWARELDAEDTLGIGFGGGEPTLYKHLPYLCDFISGETRLAVSITTHGHQATEELLKRLDRRVDFFRISIDGTGSTYERLRGRRFSALDECVQRIANRFRFGVNCVVNHYTISMLDDVADYAERRGATELLLLPEIPRVLDAGASTRLPSELRTWISSRSSRIRLSVGENGSKSIPVCDPLPEESGLMAYAHVDANATVKTSSYEATGVTIDSEGVVRAIERLGAATARLL